MVARDAGPFIDAAIRSARAQTFADIELVVVDDGSTDATRPIADAHAAEDPRVRVLDGPRAGLAAVRNASLAAARGRWAAILDSDDLIHPRHVEFLVEAATRHGAGIVAANMIEFQTGGATLRPTLVGDDPEWAVEHVVTLADYIRSNRLYAAGLKLGYFKPLFDLDFLRTEAIGYDDRMRIGEDYDLVVRAMARGADFLYLPRPTYFYRKHEASISHRMLSSDVLGMLAAADAGSGRGATADVRAALADRRAALDAALAHALALEALRGGGPVRALAHLRGSRGAWPLVWRSVRESAARRFGRLRRRASAARSEAPHALILGESAQSGALAEWLAADGWSVARRPVPGPGQEALVARDLPPAALIVLADPAAREAAPFALSPDAEILDGDDPGDFADGRPGPALAARIARARQGPR